MSAMLISTAVPVSGRSFIASNSKDSSKKPSINLTRRGRVLLLGVPAIIVTAVLVLSLMAVMFGALANPANASSTQSGAAVGHYTSTVTVLQGQSLWSIAAKSDPNRDVRDVVADIVTLNDLPSGVLQAGQQLFVPLPR